MGAILLSVLAQSEALSGTVVMDVPMARTGGPIPITVTLDWQGGGILQGTLLLDCTDLDTAECHVRRPGLALVGGPQSIRTMLPAMTAWSSRTPAELRVRFEPADGDPIDVCTVLLALPGHDLRSLVIALTRPEGGIVPSVNHDLAEQLALDRFDPNGGTGALLRCSFSQATVQGFAASPLSLCAYDLVVMAHEGFAEMSAAQLDVVARWVKAGGSVCVVPGSRAIFKPHHVAFLNRLGVGFRLDAAGAFSGESAATSPGIGRAVAAIKAEDVDWTEAAIHLWKVRAEQAKAIRADGVWRLDLQDERSRYTYRRNDTLTYVPEPISIDDATIARMLPKDLDSFSPWSIFWILLAFVALVGPGEYLLLGKLRARRFTWITFPIASVCLTAFLIGMANVRLGRGDERRTLTIVDVGADGRPLRWSRYEMLFSGFRREEEREHEQAIFVPMDYTRFRLDHYYYGYGRVEPAEVQPVVYAGDFPARTWVTQEIAQWSPQLNRISSFEPLAVADGRVGDRFRLRGKGLEVVRQSGILQQEFVLQLCARPQRGLFSVVSQISPKPDADFEDLSVLDPTDPHASLTVDVYREGSDVVVVRRLEGR